MKTMTRRERYEKAVKALRDFADDLDAQEHAPNAEQTAQLIELGRDVQATKSLWMAETGDGKGDRKVADIDSLTDAPDGATKSFLDVERTADGRIAKPTGILTLGELMVESAQYKSFKGKYGTGPDGLIPASAKNLHMDPISIGQNVKALITGASATSAGAGVRNDLYIPITDLAPMRELTILDLVTKGETTSDTVEFVRVTSKTNSAATVPEATTSATPGLNNVAVGAYTSAHGVKPESGLALAVLSTGVKTLAHWIPITKRAAADAGQVRTMVDAFLRDGLSEVIETQILSGDGTGENFTGILNSSPLTVGSAGTDLDAIVDAIAAVRVTGRNRPTGLVIHPNDWYSTGFLTAKDSAGQYLVGDPRASVEQLQTLWGLRVVVTEAMTQNTALVGDFRKAIFWEREAISLSMTDSHNDFFVRNLLVILAECRAAFAVLDPEAFCTVTAV